MAKNELVSLSLISTGPIHAYGLNLIVKGMDLEKMAKISPVSIYNALSRLKKDGCVEVNLKQVGNMPERKIYTITEKGQQRLEEEIRKAILSTNLGENLMSIAVNFAYGLPSPDIIILLKERVSKLIDSITLLKTKKTEASDCGCQQTLIMLNALIKHHEVEVGMAKELIELLENDPDYYNRQGEELRHCINQLDGNSCHSAPLDPTEPDKSN